MHTDASIIARFFLAVEDYMVSQNMRGFKTFCDVHNLPRVSLIRLQTQTHRQFHPEWLALMVTLGYSANWLLTGKGKMK